MKKFNAKHLLMQVAIIIALSVGIGFVAYAVILGQTDGPIAIGPVFFIGVVFFFLIIIWLISLATGGSSRKSEKTFNENIAAHNFQKAVIFETNDGFLAIDRVDGRIGYVSNHNPKEFQMANRSEISDIQSSYVKGPLGGTTMVYFSFRYNNKVTRIPTLISNQALSLKSDAVLEAISKADSYAEYLKGIH